MLRRKQQLAATKAWSILCILLSYLNGPLKEEQSYILADRIPSH
jgi:hypothetical protein